MGVLMGSVIVLSEPALAVGGASTVIVTSSLATYPSLSFAVSLKQYFPDVRPLTLRLVPVVFVIVQPAPEIFVQVYPTTEPPASVADPVIVVADVGSLISLSTPALTT